MFPKEKSHAVLIDLFQLFFFFNIKKKLWQVSIDINTIMKIVQFLKTRI